jgi:hypothetical protein
MLMAFKSSDEVQAEAGENEHPLIEKKPQRSSENNSPNETAA